MIAIRELDERDAKLLQNCRLFGLRESPEAFLVSHDEVAGTPLSAFQSELRDSNIHYVGAFDGDELVGFMRFVRFHRQSRAHVAEIRSVYPDKKPTQRIGIVPDLIVHSTIAGIRAGRDEILEAAMRALVDPQVHERR